MSGLYTLMKSIFTFEVLRELLFVVFRQFIWEYLDLLKSKVTA